MPGPVEDGEGVGYADEGDVAPSLKSGYDGALHLTRFRKIATIAKLHGQSNMRSDTIRSACDFLNDDDTKDFVRRLTETIAWCERVGSVEAPKTSLRSFNQDVDNPLSSQRHRVWWISHQRWTALRKNGITDLRSVEDLRGGRLLAYFPDANLCDGVAESVSQGFFDENNIPPRDTWVWMAEEQPNITDDITGSFLIAWVPPAFMELANAGIFVNPEGCMLWLDTLQFPIVASLRRLQLIP